MVLKLFLLGSILFASCTLVDGEKPSDYGSKPHRRGGSPGESSAVVSSSSAEVSSSSVVAQGSSSSAVEPSSSSVAPSSAEVSSSSVAVQGSSSSAVEPSSSSVAPSSSSAEVSSSSMAVQSSSSSAVEPSSSSVMLSSSSSTAVSSSSVAMPSSSSLASSCADFIDGTTRDHYGKSKAQFCDPRDGNKYVYVTIDSQTWMAENLNYNASGSKCYEDQDSNCSTYGRLYNWSMAVAGVCPSGWHLPSDAEWTTLTDYVGGASTAGTKLKATSGWNNYNGSSGNGTDNYGFSALPGGYGTSDGSFRSVGYFGDWWSASEFDASGAYYRDMDFSIALVFGYYDSKTSLYSVRCVQD